MPIIPATSIEIKDEGVIEGYFGSIDFAGAGVSVAPSGDVAIVTIAGGAGASWTLVEVNLGNANWRGKFTVVDALVTPASKIVIQQAPGPYTGKGTRADEAEMDPLWCVAAPGTGQFDVYWRTFTMIGTGFSNVDGSQPVTAVNTQHGNPFLASLRSRIIGRVKGNVKFLYTVT